VSRHGDRRGKETGAYLHGHHSQLREPGGPGTPVKIIGWDHVTVMFSDDNKSSEATFIGSIGRVTGTLQASSLMRMSGSITTTSYSLKCRPAQRMF
jgi:hypothetical protein